MLKALEGLALATALAASSAAGPAVFAQARRE